MTLGEVGKRIIKASILFFVTFYVKLSQNTKIKNQNNVFVKGLHAWK
jgi:hypothetical protein